LSKTHLAMPLTAAIIQQGFRHTRTRKSYTSCL